MKTKTIIMTFLFLLIVMPLFSLDRVVDNAGLLSPIEKNRLAGYISSIAALFDFDLVIVTENSIGNAIAMNYADDYFDYNNYGLGNDRDGCLFLVVMGSREYWISTSGRGIGLLNDFAFRKLSAETAKFLGEGNYYGAFNAYLENWDEFLTLESKNRSYNFFYKWNMVLVLISWSLALMAGFMIVMAWEKGMNTAHIKTQASAYIIPGSLVFRERKDSFLYSMVSKTRRQTSSSSGGGGGGVHRGSSGRSHGGGGGRF